MTTQTILAEVHTEREYQTEKWGTDNDAFNTPFHWNAYINQYASRHLIGTPLDETDPVLFRVDMIKVAALAVAAVEALDRNT